MTARAPRVARVAPKMRLGSDGERALETQIRQLGLPEPIREFAFAKAAGRRWRFDFCWPAADGTPGGWAAEVEGGTWIAGAHTRGRHFESDAEKYAEAALMGWKVIRVTTDMVSDGRAISLLERALRHG